METNFQEKRVLNNMMKNRPIGGSLGLEKKRDAVLEVIAKQKITTDIGKLPGYKKEAFLKAINRTIGIGYEAKKAFQSTYGKNPVRSVKQKTDKAVELTRKRKSYDEIINKREASFQSGTKTAFSEYQPPLVTDFRTSNKNLRSASGLLGAENRNVIKDDRSNFTQNRQEGNDNIKDALKRIQA